MYCGKASACDLLSERVMLPSLTDKDVQLTMQVVMLCYDTQSKSTTQGKNPTENKPPTTLLVQCRLFDSRFYLPVSIAYDRLL